MQVAVYAPCVGEGVTEIEPRLGQHLLGPRDARYEEEDEGGGDEHDQSRFAVAGEDADAYREIDDRQQVGHHEAEDVHRVADVRESEETRNEYQIEGSECHVEHEVGCGASENDTEHTDAAPSAGEYEEFVVLLACRTSQHADAEEERLVEDKHEHGRYEERGVTACGTEQCRLGVGGVLHE